MSDSNIVNVAQKLADRAATCPYVPAVIFPETRDGRGRVAYTHYTFEQLHQVSDAAAHGLQSVGITRGMRTVLMVKPSLDFFALTFALFKVGAVPVMIDPGMGIRNLGRCLAEAEPEAFLGIPKAHLARKLLRWAKKTLRITVTTGSRAIGAQYALRRLIESGRAQGPFPQADTREDEIAAILFTSGSTGIAKGVVYTHGIFATQTRLLAEMYGIQPGEIDLATFPLFALFAPALGMTAIVPEMDPTRPAEVDPRKIIEAVRNFGVTNLFGSPALIHRVGRFGEEHAVQLPSLRRVISAGAPVPAKVIERFAKLLTPGAEVHTPYGATEALPVASIGSGTILSETRNETDRGGGVCVGHPVPGIEVRIIPIRDEPIPTMESSLALPVGVIGEIAVCGPVVTTRYFHRPLADAMAKMTDEAGRTWHRMGDLGKWDQSGRIWFCGRKTQRVQTEAGTLFTIPCEAIFNTHPDVFRSALVGVVQGGKTHPVICVELEPHAKIRSESAFFEELRRLAESHEHTRTITTFLIHRKFPVDIRHNAKIFREKLAVWASRFRIADR